MNDMAGIAVLKDNVKFYIGEAESLTADDKLGNVVSISDIGGEAEEIDTTTIDSMAKESVGGFEDNGQIDIVQNITEEEFTKMDSWKKAGTELHWGLIANKRNGDKLLGLKGKGFVKSAKLTGISVGGLLQVNASVRLTGEIGTDFEDPN